MAKARAKQGKIGKDQRLAQYGVLGIRNHRVKADERQRQPGRDVQIAAQRHEQAQRKASCGRKQGHARTTAQPCALRHARPRQGVEQKGSGQQGQYRQHAYAGPCSAKSCVNVALMRRVMARRACLINAGRACHQAVDTQADAFAVGNDIDRKLHKR